MVALGPIPECLRETVRDWIEAGRHSEPRTTNDTVGGLFIYGGPVFCCYLDADGVIRTWDAFDESVAVVADGPVKVGIVAIAAEYYPELAAWLPRRPARAEGCGSCGGSG